jgi:hypothetical protein
MELIAHVPLKRRLTFNGLHGVISQNIILFIMNTGHCLFKLGRTADEQQWRILKVGALNNSIFDERRMDISDIILIISSFSNNGHPV